MIKISEDKDLFENTDATEDVNRVTQLEIGREGKEAIEDKAGEGAGVIKTKEVGEASQKNFRVENSLDILHESQTDESLDTSKDVVRFFVLPPSFPLTPLSQSETTLLPRHFQSNSPPDLSTSQPVPGSNGSFFIFSSLSPIPVSCSTKQSRNIKPKKKNKQTTSAVCVTRRQV